MKRFISGLLIMAIGLLFSSVSFASDGPTTAKVCFDDLDHLLIPSVSTATIEVELELTNLSKIDVLCVNDVGKDYAKKDSKEYHFGLPSYFNWEVYRFLSTNRHENYHDYINKPINVSYQTPSVNKYDIRNRLLC